jgi:hypothetical protein
MDFIIQQHEQQQRVPRDPSPPMTHRPVIAPYQQYPQDQAPIAPKSPTPSYLQAPYFNPLHPHTLNPPMRGSHLKTGSRIILQREVDQRLTTQDIEGARPRDLSITKGRRHKDFFNEYSELNEIYNKIGY